MRYIEPPMSLLRGISADLNPEVSLDVYCSGNVLLRRFFWLRLRLLCHLIGRVAPAPGECLDFGGGSGVFLPTLAAGFHRVTVIDRNTAEARQLVARLGLDRVDLVNADILAHDFTGRRFDAVIAADVLEHFLDLDPPIERIRTWLAPGGVLFTSLPSENVAYRTLRVVFGKQKPEDHYHGAAEVERRLRGHNFRKIVGLYHPLYLRVAPLFYISAWQRL